MKCKVCNNDINEETKLCPICLSNSYNTDEGRYENMDGEESNESFEFNDDMFVNIKFDTVLFVISITMIVVCVIYATLS